MVAIFLQTLPFFALIGLGYGAGRRGFFSPEATAALTRFVFYFALSAMIFGFAARLDLAEVLDWNLIWAYLLATSAVYLIATAVALIRRRGIEEAAVEAQIAAIGNVGFLGIPMLAQIFGAEAVGTIMLILAVDLIVFSSLIVILITGSRDGRLSPRVLATVGRGLLANPMIVAITLGFAWSATGWTIPAPADRFLSILGSAATPGALFAIGASLASKSAEKLVIAGWLSFAKLVLHPAAVAVTTLLLFPVPPYTAAVAIAAASLPVAGNVYMLAQHYGVAPSRASAAILVSTTLSIITVSLVISWVFP
ncbi:MAG: malate transporter [Rhodobacterales bacterium]|nr:MAG: malate transporter [Rhodobacterales bacterium]